MPARGLSRVKGFIMPLRRVVARRADVCWVQSSYLRTRVNEFVTRFDTALLGQGYSGEFRTVLDHCRSLRALFFVGFHLA